MKRLIFFIFSFSYIFSFGQDEIPAFPGAEGGGMYTTGGRGGSVYFVTSLEDTNTGNTGTGEGTLRWCLAQPGPRTIIFKVSGIIRLKSGLTIPANTTIAGQTAPGDGICIADNNVQLGGNNLIVRYMRFRMGDLTNVENDAFWGRNYTNVIIDHCSMSWSTDECASFYDNTNFTLQWSILSESLRASVHDKGNHGYGGIWGGKTATFHHNLLAHHDSRNPRMCGSRYSNKPELELVDFRNNVIYNWGSNSGYAGEGGSYNFVNNYYKPTSSSSNTTRIFQPYGDDGKNKQPKGVWGKFYVSGNYMYGSESVTKDNWLGIHPDAGKSKDLLRSDTVFEVPFVTTHSAEKAYEEVLKIAGASYRRDSTDMRIIDEVTNLLAPQRASNGTTRGGLIDSQSDVGGWEVYSYNSEEVPADLDRDGMADDWETEKGLNPNDNSDRNKLDTSGYTMLEVYMNSILGESNVSGNNTKVNGFKGRVYPNPVINKSKVSFNIKQESLIRIDILSISGQLLVNVCSKNFNEGFHEITMDTDTLSRGVYICRINSVSGYNQLIKFAVNR